MLCLKGLASTLLEQIKISCYTEYKVFEPPLIYNISKKGPAIFNIVLFTLNLIVIIVIVKTKFYCRCVNYY